MARMGADNEMIHKEFSKQIIGASMAVLNELKPGLDEKLYENALVIELQERGLAISQQERFPVTYKGRPIGTLVPDLIVEGKVIVDPKVVSTFCDDHVAQIMGCLAITGLELGLLLNFKYARLDWKRIARSPHDS
jgi:GxxExxY protein